MKKFFIIAGMLTAGAISAQQKGSVGINSTVDGATLDVQVATSGVDATKGQGIAFPRVNVSTLNAMGGTIATSAMVYVENVDTTSSIERTKGVDAVGYYFFNGTKWTKLGTAETNTFTRAYREDAGSTVQVADDDYFIRLKNQGGGTITLPSATNANKGRVYCFLNDGNSSFATGAVGGAGNVQPSYTACVISSGSEWVTHTTI